MSFVDAMVGARPLVANVRRGSDDTGAYQSNCSAAAIPMRKSMSMEVIGGGLYCIALIYDSGLD